MRPYNPEDKEAKYRTMIDRNDVVHVRNDRILAKCSKRYFDKHGRGVVLSEAMAKLGNISELKRLKNVEMTADDIKAVTDSVYKMLVVKWLGEHSQYADCVKRYVLNARMSLGMQYEVDQAKAYADGHFHEVDNDFICKKYAELTPKYSSKNRVETVLFEMNKSDPDFNLENEILKYFLQKDEFEIEYREFRTKIPIEVTVIDPCSMPSQIGMCTYTN